MGTHWAPSPRTGGRFPEGIPELRSSGGAHECLACPGVPTRDGNGTRIQNWVCRLPSRTPGGTMAQQTRAEAVRMLRAMEGAARALAGLGQGQASRPIAEAGGGCRGGAWMWGVPSGQDQVEDPGCGWVGCGTGAVRGLSGASLSTTPAQGLGRAHAHPQACTCGPPSGLSWRTPSTPQRRLSEAWVPTGGVGGL